MQNSDAFCQHVNQRKHRRKIVNHLVALTGESRKSQAIARVVTGWVRRQKAKQFGQKLLEGYYDYPLDREAIESLNR